MSKLLVRDENGKEYVIDFERGKELGIIKAKINDLWYPANKEGYYYCTDSLMVRNCTYKNSFENLGRMHKGNIFKDPESAKIYAGYLRADINTLILKFAIENDCLANVNDLKDKETTKKFFILIFNIEENKYVVTDICFARNLAHTVTLTDEDKANEIARIINERELGLIRKENYKEDLVRASKEEHISEK